MIKLFQNCANTTTSNYFYWGPTRYILLFHHVNVMLATCRVAQPHRIYYYYYYDYFVYQMYIHVVKIGLG